MTIIQSTFYGFEIESRRLPFPKIFHGTVVGIHRQIIPTINQPGRIKDSPNVRFAVLWFQLRESAKFADFRLPAPLNALAQLLSNLVFVGSPKLRSITMQQRHAVI